MLSNACNMNFRGKIATCKPTPALFGEGSQEMTHKLRCTLTLSRHGVGIYHYFRDAAVTVQSAIIAPTALEPNFVSPLSVAGRQMVFQAAQVSWHVPSTC